MSNCDVLNSRVLPLFAIERPSQESLSDANLKDMAEVVAQPVVVVARENERARPRIYVLRPLRTGVVRGSVLRVLSISVQ